MSFLTRSTRCFPVKISRSFLRACTFAAAAASLASTADADTMFGHLPFDSVVPVSYAQLAPSGGTLRARVEAVPGVAIGELQGVAPSEQAITSGQTARAWSSGFGFSSRVGSDSNGSGFRTKGGGVVAGFDRFLSPTLLAGVALGYSRTETNGIGTRNESDTISGAIYGAWAPYPGWELEGLIGIDHAEIDTSRVLIFGTIPVTTRGDTRSLGFNAAGNIGYRFQFAAPVGAAFVKPFAGLSYASQDRDGYSELGQFGPGLVFPSKTFERSTFNLGAATGIDIDAGNGWIVRPELRAAWSRYLSDPSPDVPAFLGGVPIVLRDPQPGRDGAIVGAEITGITNGLQLFAGYAGEFRSNSTAHQGRVGLRLTW